MSVSWQKWPQTVEVVEGLSKKLGDRADVGHGGQEIVDYKHRSNDSGLKRIKKKNESDHNGHKGLIVWEIL